MWGSVVKKLCQNWWFLQRRWFYFILFITLKEKQNLVGSGNFWKHQQIRDYIRRNIQLHRGTIPMLCHLQLPTTYHKASSWYERCPWTNRNISTTFPLPGKKILHVPWWVIGEQYFQKLEICQGSQRRIYLIQNSWYHYPPSLT